MSLQKGLVANTRHEDTELSDLSSCWAQFFLMNVFRLYRWHLHLAEIWCNVNLTTFTCSLTIRSKSEENVFWVHLHFTSKYHMWSAVWFYSEIQLAVLSAVLYSPNNKVVLLWAEQSNTLQLALQWNKILPILNSSNHG